MHFSNILNVLQIKIHISNINCEKLKFDYELLKKDKIWKLLKQLVYEQINIFTIF